MKYSLSILLPAVAALAAATVIPCEAHAHVFGRCARQDKAAIKIEACMAAVQLTNSRPVLHWVYRELARGYREQGQTAQAISSYLDALAARDRDAIRLEMAQLLVLRHSGAAAE